MIGRLLCWLGLHNRSIDWVSEVHTHYSLCERCGK